jgi:hypothetical protein
MLVGCDGLLRLTLARRIATNGRFAPAPVIPTGRLLIQMRHWSYRPTRGAGTGAGTRRIYPSLGSKCGISARV